MSINHILRLSALLVLSALGAVAADTAATSLKTIILVRHAERVRPNEDVSLSEKGHGRAKALAYLLKDQSFRAIFTSQMIRTKETAQPVAAAAGIVPEVVPADRTDDLVAKLKALKPGENALVVHHSNTIPKIVDALGAGTIPPIPEDEFDRLLVVTMPVSGKPAVVTLRYGGK